MVGWIVPANVVSIRLGCAVPGIGVLGALPGAAASLALLPARRSTARLLAEE